MAAAGGGRYYPAANAAELSTAILDASGERPTPTPTATPPAAATACGFTLSAEVLAKWQEIGGEKGVLGCPAANESEAAGAPAGTTGRVARFVGGGQGGLIALHGSGERAEEIRAFDEDEEASFLVVATR